MPRVVTEVERNNTDGMVELTTAESFYDCTREVCIRAKQESYKQGT